MTPPRRTIRLLPNLELRFPEYQALEGTQGDNTPLVESSTYSLEAPAITEGSSTWWENFRFFEPRWSQFLRMPEEVARRVLPEVLLSIIPSWEDFVVQLANNFYAVDLDMNNMPLNRGSNLHRFSEWTDRRGRPDSPNLQVQPNTLATGHGEIRPIQGRDESLITRVNVDYTPNLIYVLSGIIPDLEIDQFAAVDPPQITYDWSRLPRSPVTALSGGDLTYENPGLSGEAPTTPFASVRPAPPGGHDYWMFHFNPIADTLVASLEEAVSDGQTVFQLNGLGALNLWAFLPTFGITDPADYEALGIPFNTFPRRFGDLIRLLWPQFTPEGRQIREDAPLINPNTEYWAHHYMDGQGRPQAIPDDSTTSYTPHYEVRFYRDSEDHPHRIPQDSESLAALNRRREGEGLPAVQGGIWRPIPEDETELDAINQAHRELNLAAVSRLRRRRIPNNRREVVRINEQIQALNRREGLQIDLLSASRGPAVDWIGLDLARDPERLAATPDVQLPRAVFHAMMRDVLLRLPLGSIQCNEGTEFTIRYNLQRVINERTGQAEPRFGIQVTFHPLDLGPMDLLLPGPTSPEGTTPPEGRLGSLGIRARGLQARRITVNIPDVTQLVEVLGQSEETFGERLGHSGLSVTLDGVQAQDLRIDNDQFQIALDRGRIRQVQFRSDGSGWRTAIRGLRAHNLTIGGEETELQIQAQRQSQDIFVSQQGNGRIRARMDLHGGIEWAQLAHPTIGELRFTTLDPERPEIAAGCEGRDCPDGGRITFESGQEGSQRSFGLNLQLPYFGFWTPNDALMRIERGSSSIRDAAVRVNSEGMQLEGDLNIQAAMPRGFGSGPTQLFESNTRLDSQIENLRATGRVRVTTYPGGWRLEGPSEDNPLNLSFSLANSSFHHRPNEFPPYLRNRTSREVVQTDVAIERADVRLENFREARYREVEVDGETQGRLEHLESGPITLNNIRGSGNIWVNLVIWGFVQGLFPQLGNHPSGPAVTRRRAYPDLPDRGPLLQHLPEDVRTQLGSEDFLRIGGVRMHSTGPGEQLTEIDDILLHIHETAGRGQFGLIRVPHLSLGRHEGAPFWQLDPRFIVNIFLNSPPRGGSFHFVRWPER